MTLVASKCFGVLMGTNITLGICPQCLWNLNLPHALVGTASGAEGSKTVLSQ